MAQPNKHDEGDIDRARRIINSYQKSKLETDKQNKDTDFWDKIKYDVFSGIIDVFSTKNPEKSLIELFISYGKNYTPFGGFTLGRDGFTPIGMTAGQISHVYFDHILNLAVFLGILPIETPEAPGVSWGRNIHLDHNSVIEQIESKIGFPISPEKLVSPTLGIQSKNGPVHYRHVNALYAALRIRELTDSDSAVVEIGGGLGLVAYYLRKLGYKDITLVDMPLANVFSGNFLIGQFGSDVVCLDGDDWEEGKIRIVSDNRFLQNEEGKIYDIAVNQDSFTEIDRRIVNKYIDLISKTTRKFFFSINHEAPENKSVSLEEKVYVTVKQSILDYGHCYRKIYRQPYWIRQGYVEELWAVESG